MFLSPPQTSKKIYIFFGKPRPLLRLVLCVLLSVHLSDHPNTFAETLTRCNATWQLNKRLIFHNCFVIQLANSSRIASSWQQTPLKIRGKLLLRFDCKIWGHYSLQTEISYPIFSIQPRYWCVSVIVNSICAWNFQSIYTQLLDLHVFQWRRLDLCYSSASRICWQSAICRISFSLVCNNIRYFSYP